MGHNLPRCLGRTGPIRSTPPPRSRLSCRLGIGYRGMPHGSALRVRSNPQSRSWPGSWPTGSCSSCPGGSDHSPVASPPRLLRDPSELPTTRRIQLRRQRTTERSFTVGERDGHTCSLHAISGANIVFDQYRYSVKGPITIRKIERPKTQQVTHPLICLVARSLSRPLAIFRASGLISVTAFSLSLVSSIRRM